MAARSRFPVPDVGEFPFIILLTTKDQGLATEDHFPLWLPLGHAFRWPFWKPPPFFGSLVDPRWTAHSNTVLD